MIKGEITCNCGQLFGYETERDYVECPTCGEAFNALEYQIIDEEGEGDAS